MLLLADIKVISPGSGGEVLSWNWDNHTRQMAGLMGGLGMVAVVVSVTLQCYPLANMIRRINLNFLSR